MTGPGPERDGRTAAAASSNSVTDVIHLRKCRLRWTLSNPTVSEAKHRKQEEDVPRRRRRALPARRTYLALQ